MCPEKPVGQGTRLQPDCWDPLVTSYGTYLGAPLFHCERVRPVTYKAY